MNDIYIYILTYTAIHIILHIIDNEIIYTIYSYALQAQITLSCIPIGHWLLPI